jgi:hypothetical protein
MHRHGYFHRDMVYIITKIEQKIILYIKKLETRKFA